MKKILKVVLHNFKSHKHSEIPLNDFTVIIGPSNAGKSTIIKGIRFCLYNEPSGRRFIKHGQSFCYVQIWFNDGTSIKRSVGTDENGNDVNSYELYYADGRCELLTNFGMGSVDPVVAFHGMPKVNLFGDLESLNICDQHSAPFLLSAKPTQLGKMIGHMAKTDVSDLALQMINSEVRKSKATKKELEAQLKNVDAELDTMKDLPMAKLALESLASKFELNEEMKQKFIRITVLYEQIKNLQSQKAQLENIISNAEGVDKVIDNLDYLLLLNSKMERVISLQKNLVSAQETRDTAQRICSSIDMEKLELVTNVLNSVMIMMNTLVESNKVYNKLKETTAQKESAEKIVSGIKDTDHIVEQLDLVQQKITQLNQVLALKLKLQNETQRAEKGKGIIAELEQSYEDKVGDYRKMLIDSKHCPVCFSEMTAEKVSGIKDII